MKLIRFSAEGRTSTGVVVGDAVVDVGRRAPDLAAIDAMLGAREEVARLVQGATADYRLDQVVGADLVQSWGGRVLLAELMPGHSTTATIRRIAH